MEVRLCGMREDRGGWEGAAIIALRASVGIRMMIDTLLDVWGERVVAVVGDRKLEGENMYPVTSLSSGLGMALEALKPKLYKVVMRVLSEEKVSFVYFVSTHPGNLGVLILLRAWRVVSNAEYTLVVHIHDPQPHTGARYPFVIVVVNWMQVLLSDRCVVYGEFVRRQLLNRHPVTPERVIVSRHPIYRNVSAYGEEDGSTLGAANPGQEFITLFGRMRNYKGIELFVEVAEMSRGVLEQVFLLAGPGECPDLRRLRRAGRLSAPNIRVINRELNVGQLDQLLKRTAVVVLPYIEATHSGNVAVAMYNSCPVVVTDVGGLSEDVIDGVNGSIVQRKGSDAIYEVVREMVLDRNKLEKLSKGAKRYSQEKLHPGKVYGQLWHEIMGSQ